MNVLMLPCKEQTVCFSGHRPQRLPWQFEEQDSRCVSLKQALEATVINCINAGFLHFVSGGAQGTDTWAAELILSLKHTYESLTLEIAVPFAGQDRGWSPQCQARYREILSQADCVQVLQSHYTQGCMAVRNAFMVQRSAVLIAVSDGKHGGGTHQTIEMAKREGLAIYLLSPT